MTNSRRHHSLERFHAKHGQRFHDKAGYSEVAKKRFFQKIKKVNKCWEWQGCISSKGYGTFGFFGKWCKAHRASYMLFVGKIPEGLTIDHKCKNKKCVNPEHLRPMTMRDNILLGENCAAVNAKKTHCKRGHEFLKENIYPLKMKNGRNSRSCRICIKIRSVYNNKKRYVK